MRLRPLATSFLLLAVSAGSVTTLAASPDCARWIREYQQALAKRAVIAKRHVTHVAHRITAPRPKLLRASIPAVRTHGPRLSPAEMLHRFKVLCGEDLPDDTVPVEFIPTSLNASLIPPAAPFDGPVPTELVNPAVSTPGSYTPPAILTSGTIGTPTGPFIPIAPISSGMPPVSITPTTPGTPASPTNPVSPTTPGNPTTPAVPNTPEAPSPVPEPSTLFLLLTGGLGVILVLLRRSRKIMAKAN